MSLWALFMYPTGLAASLLASAAYVWYCKPILLARFGLFLALRKCGLKVKYVKGKKYTYCYGERGERTPDRPSLLLIHGFSASKDMFAPLVKRLPGDLHIVVMDLPGHGGSTVPTADEDLSIDSFCLFVHEFVDLMSLHSKPFHLIGTSMGGVIVAAYAMKYPEQLERLSLVCPAFETPVSTDFLDAAKRGECQMIPETVDEMRVMLDMCFYNKNVIPQQKQILQGALDIRTPRNHFFQRLFDALIKYGKENQNRLEEEAKKEKSTDWLIWGKQDEIIHVSGADRLQKILPNVQRVDLFENCGHSITYDNPRSFSKCLVQFQGENQSEQLKKIQ